MTSDEARARLEAIAEMVRGLPRDHAHTHLRVDLGVSTDAVAFLLAAGATAKTSLYRYPVRGDKAIDFATGTFGGVDFDAQSKQRTATATESATLDEGADSVPDCVRSTTVTA